MFLTCRARICLPGMFYTSPAIWKSPDFILKSSTPFSSFLLCSKYLIYPMLPHCLWDFYAYANSPCSCIKIWFSPINLFLFLKKDSICLFLESRREGKREGEKHQCVRTYIGCLSYVPQLGTKPTTQACALSRNGIGNLSLCRMMTNPTEPHWLGLSLLISLLA